MIEIIAAAATVLGSSLLSYCYLTKTEAYLIAESLENNSTGDWERITSEKPIDIGWRSEVMDATIYEGMRDSYIRLMAGDYELAALTFREKLRITRAFKKAEKNKRRKDKGQQRLDERGKLMARVQNATHIDNHCVCTDCSNKSRFAKRPPSGVYTPTGCTLGEG